MGVYKRSEIQPGVDESTRLAQQAQVSEQYRRVGNAFEERQVKLESDFHPSVVYLQDDETGDKATRVDFRFKASVEGDYRALIQAFFPEEAPQETVGYLHYGNLLLWQVIADEFTLQAEKTRVCVIEWAGGAVMSERISGDERLLG